MILRSTLRQALSAIFDAADRDVVVLHAAPRAIGDVVGGIDAIVTALLEALGPRRTLVMPAFTNHLTDPRCWSDPPAPPALYDAIADEMLPFDKRASTPRKMGRIVDRLIAHPDVERSDHPAESVAAIGPRAREIVAKHALDDPWGARSPWALATASDAAVVLLGVGFARCSIVHHAERLADPPYGDACGYSMPVGTGASREWIEVTSGAGCSEGFDAIAPILRENELVADGWVGAAPVMSLHAARLVEIGREVFARDPASMLCRDSTCAACNAARGELHRTPPWTPQ